MKMLEHEEYFLAVKSPGMTSFALLRIEFDGEVPLMMVRSGKNSEDRPECHQIPISSTFNRRPELIEEMGI